jgi:hypothetical protein
MKKFKTIVCVGLVICLTSTAWPVIAPNDNFPVAGGDYASTNGAKYFSSTEEFQAEIVSMSLSGASAQDPISVSRLGNDSFSVDSFFDVFTELSVDGGSSFSVESFFDVFTELSVGGDGSTGSWDTEIVSMSLSGTIGDNSVIIRESPSILSVGSLTVVDLGGGQFHIDSFFDVFTELSVDGGGTWMVADGPIRMELITPEPATLALLGIGGLLIRKRRA